jgi:hypothetical protein
LFASRSQEGRGLFLKKGGNKKYIGDLDPDFYHPYLDLDFVTSHFFYLEFDPHFNALVQVRPTLYSICPPEV